MTKLNFHPAPGYILAKPMTREELAKSSTSLTLPDNVGKEKDSVGIAQIIETGKPLQELSNGEAFSSWEGEELKPGQLVAYIPFTDAIIMDGFEKFNLIAYKNIMAIADPLPVEKKAK